MSQKPDGGPAFPRPDGLLTPGAYGMTLRDYFAGQVISGLLRHYDTWQEAVEGAYALSDLMIAERKNRE